MMHRLYVRVALSVALALIVAAAMMEALVRSTVRHGDRTMAERAGGSGFRVIARELSRLPRHARAQRLAEFAEVVSHPVELRDERPHDRRDVALHARAVQREGYAVPWVSVRIDETQVVLFGPPRDWDTHRPPMPLGPFRTPTPALVAFMVLVVLLTSMLIAVPLTRRMRAIERAVELLSTGDFRARTEGPRDDMLGGIARALDRSAERLQRLFAERDELLQAVSHEIGTPLSRMRFHIEMLGTLDDPAQRETSSAR
jgi:signal transduction histidine kinase